MERSRLHVQVTSSKLTSGESSGARVRRDRLLLRIWLSVLTGNPSLPDKLGSANRT